MQNRLEIRTKTYFVLRSMPRSCKFREAE